jgi:hypothetical protein
MIFINNCSAFTNDEIIEMAKFAGNNFDDFRILSRDNSLKVYDTILKEEEYSSMNFYFVADACWINVYSRKEIRDQKYLPLPDEFYLNIPAYKIEKLSNGNIFVQLFEDGDGVEQEGIATKKAIEYYKEYLTKLGIWGHMKYTLNWREKN